jgi:hypothetical protein
VLREREYLPCDCDPARVRIASRENHRMFRLLQLATLKNRDAVRTSIAPVSIFRSW